jgi:NDP-sugar pyrophosphorylase family protein
MQVVIPAGYNKQFPVMRKPQAFLEVAGNQIFESVLEKLKGHEILVVTPFPDEFKKYDVQVLEDEFSGSASALRAVDKLVEDDFAVHYSDVFTPARLEPLINFHERMHPYMTMGLSRTQNPWRYGVASTDPSGRVVRFLHEPRPDLVFSNTVSSGIMVLNRKVYDKIPYKMEMPELVTYLVQRKMPVYGYEFKTFWYHIGSVAEYVEANRDYLQRRMEMTQDNVRGVNIYPPVSLRDVKGDASFVGPHVSAYDVELGNGAKVKNSVIYPGSVIGDNANISETIIGPNVKIGDNAVVTESLIGEDSVVADDVKVGRSIIGIEREIMGKVFEMELL